MNDIVPIILPSPENSTTYTVVINLDVNGYTWDITNASNATVAAQSNFYGETTGQFGTQAMMYTQYYTSQVDMQLTLSSGGSTYSVSPLVHFVNPNGTQPFILGSGGFTSLLSAPQNTIVQQPYMVHNHCIDYKKWLVSMTDRCWRKSIANPATSMAREQYPTDGVSSEDFVLPSQTSVFQITIPENRFAANANSYVIGVFRARTHYAFSQRRTDINQLVAESRERVLSQAKIQPAHYSVQAKTSM